jgi:membrane protease YdiL (CAAX protease family)
MNRIERLTNHRPCLFVLVSWLGWMLVAAVGVAIFSALSSRPGADEASQSAGMLLATICLLLLLSRLGWLGSIGITRPGSWQVWLVALITGTYLVFAYLFAFFGRPALNPVILTSTTAARAIIWRQLVVGLAEETLFRGFLFYGLSRVWGSKRWGNPAAVALTALLFAIPHLGQLAIGVSLPSVLLLLLDAVISGIWWGALVLRWKSLWPTILLHAISNMAVGLQGLSMAAVEPAALGYGRAVLLDLPLLAYGTWLLWRPVRPEGNNKVPATSGWQALVGGNCGGTRSGGVPPGECF